MADVDISKYGLRSLPESSKEEVNISDYGMRPYEENESEENKDQKENLIGEIPGLPGELMKASSGIMMGLSNPKQAISNRVKGAGQGITDIAQGLAQATRQFREYAGLNPIGSTDEWTKKDAERMAYNQSPSGQDPFSQLIRKGVNQIPYAATGAALSAPVGLLGKAALSGATNAGLNALQYVPEGGSRGENALVGGAIGTALPIVPEIPGAISKITNPFSLQNRSKYASKLLQAGHDTLLSESENLYNKVAEEVKKRELDNIPVTRSLITQANKYLPKTDAVKSLINRASTGDYEAIRDLQSDLGSEGRKSANAELSADRHKAEEALELRKKINDEVSTFFDKSGHPDLSDALQEANLKYQKLHKIYYEKNPVISKLVHKETREIPANIFTTISKDSVPVNRLLKENPAVEDALERHKAISKMKTVGKIGAFAAPALLTEEYLRRR